MRRLFLFTLLFISLGCLDVTFQRTLMGQVDNAVKVSKADYVTRSQSRVVGCLFFSCGEAETAPVTRIEINSSPPLVPETKPLSEWQTTSPLSIDSSVSNPDFMIYRPYNTYPRELNLWRLEAIKFIRSDAVVSPDKQAFVYTEVTYMSHNRQTMAKLFWVPVPPLPAQPLERLPSEEVENPAPPLPDPAEYVARFNPDKTLKLRKPLVSVGFDKSNPYEFRTLTIVDWSSTGQKLLFKQRSGVTHIGLRTSNILVYDQDRGTVTIYPEVHRVIQHYWMTQGNLTNMERLAWDIQPLGWEPGSDSSILLKAWAYDRKEKKYLGLWRYDVDAERTQLLSLENIPSPVAANGYLVSPAPIPRQSKKATSKGGL